MSQFYYPDVSKSSIPKICLWLTQFNSCIKAFCHWENESIGVELKST